MKEHTYGWYPSAKNVYEERRMGALTPYQIEALYRFRDSKYYQPPVTPNEQRTPRPPRPSPSPARRPESTVSRASQKSGYADLQLRASSAPIHTTYKPPPKLIIPTPQQCWSTHVPETEITVVPPKSAPASKRETPVPVAVMDIHSRENVMQNVIRIKSATVRRETPSRPQRPSKSAGPTRPTPPPVTPELHMQSYSPLSDHDVTTRVYMSDRPPSVSFPTSRPMAPSPATAERPTSSKRVTSRSTIPSPSAKPPSGKRTPLRPNAPSPYKMDLHLDENEYGDHQGEDEYDSMAKKYGWMMEVQGDPLKIKKVSQRLPYTVQVKEPETERDPPKVHMENIETFFLNTIPRRPMAFTIDKEWISEMIHKKRIDMQKKHGLNYRYKNFSFVY